MGQAALETVHSDLKFHFRPNSTPKHAAGRQSLLSLSPAGALFEPVARTSIAAGLRIVALVPPKVPLEQREKGGIFGLPLMGLTSERKLININPHDTKVHAAS